MSADLVDRLRSVLGDVVDDPDILDSHRNDHATFCTAGIPRALVRPSSTAEVQEVVRIGRRAAKGVAGYDLTRLIVGSEGTLGVVTEATLALRPAPEAALTAAATFLSIEDGIAAAAAVMASGLRPSLLEFLDRPTARAIQDYRDMGLPADVGALLIAQS